MVGQGDAPMPASCPSGPRSSRAAPDLRPRAAPELAVAGKELAPERESLLTQQGGAVVLDGQQTVFRWVCAAGWLAAGSPVVSRVCVLSCLPTAAPIHPACLASLSHLLPLVRRNDPRSPTFYFAVSSS